MAARLICLTALFCAILGPAAWGRPPASDGSSRIHSLFVPADRCMACHNGLISPDGENVSIGTDWRSSIMANSSRDPYWQASVRREVMDHPSAQSAIEDECAACHMPMSRYMAQAAGSEGQIFAHLPIADASDPQELLAADGVSCTMCHQIEAERLGEESSFTAGFVVDTFRELGQRVIFGPFEITPGRKRIMNSAAQFSPEKASHLKSSELCATCHTLYTHALGEEAEVVGELPEQVPYLEWLHSDYPDREQSCQFCHMPVVDSAMPISAVWGEDREGFSRHVFRGGNFFMLRLFNRYRDLLGVEAAPVELERAAEQTAKKLAAESAAILIEGISLSDETVEVRVRVQNLTGHKLPTAYPSRRAWIHLKATDRNGETVFESGAFRSDGSIMGNDNDLDPDTFEPHYERIDSVDQVQIYEGILAGPQGEVTTGLLTAVTYVKDNRVLPQGFDKETAGEDIAVRGRASRDANFNGLGDEIVYVLELPRMQRPLTIEAVLWYQPIAFRWAHNLAPYDSLETNRFVSMYDSMASSSALAIDRDTRVVRD